MVNDRGSATVACGERPGRPAGRGPSKSLESAEVGRNRPGPSSRGVAAGRTARSHRRGRRVPVPSRRCLCGESPLLGHPQGWVPGLSAAASANVVRRGPPHSVHLSASPSAPFQTPSVVTRFAERPSAATCQLPWRRPRRKARIRTRLVRRREKRGPTQLSPPRRRRPSAAACPRCGTRRRTRPTPRASARCWI